MGVIIFLVFATVFQANSIESSDFLDISRLGRADWGNGGGAAVLDHDDSIKYVFPAKPRSAKDDHEWDKNQYTARAADQYKSRIGDQYNVEDQYMPGDQYKLEDQYSSRAGDQYKMQDQYSSGTDDQYKYRADEQYRDDWDRKDDYYDGNYYYDDDNLYYNDDVDRQELSTSTLNPLAAIIAPLAGFALLAAAAAVAVNPLLMELVTISGRKKREAGKEEEDDLLLHILSGGRGRREVDSEEEEDLINILDGGRGRREAGKDDEDENEGEGNNIQQNLRQLNVLEKFLGRLPGQEAGAHLLMAQYIDCSGLKESLCLDYLVCQYASKDTVYSKDEKSVVSIILYNLMANKHLQNTLKERWRTAANYGRKSGSCTIFRCPSIN